MFSAWDYSTIRFPWLSCILCEKVFQLLPPYKSTESQRYAHTSANHTEHQTCCCSITKYGVAQWLLLPNNNRWSSVWSFVSASQAYFTYGVDEMVLNLSRRVKTLISISIGKYKSFGWLDMYSVISTMLRIESSA
ncbi:unnamed protein product [Angiostrongylus costaricensis]|uniref:Secreted protein n=1 Tax=Angiostrongylus costaricensis TaxID=334426 RepID=A0A0R3Q1C6_ANGCS|nr:unnamed protein product [Angiostrongylus costaricensis]